MKLKRLFDRAFPMRIRVATADDRNAVVRKIMVRCPVCMLDLNGHAYATLATLFASDTAAMHEVEEAIKNADWSPVTRFQQWNPDADVVQYDVLRCSRREELALVRILYTADMWAVDVANREWTLTREDSQSLLAQCAVDWASL